MNSWKNEIHLDYKDLGECDVISCVLSAVFNVQVNSRPFNRNWFLKTTANRWFLQAGPEPDRSEDVISYIPLTQWIKVASLKPSNVIITFNQHIDKLLGGGIMPGRMTEIFGEKGAGKTTLCMQLCITVQLPRKIQGLEAEAIFIDTEQTFTVQRLNEMIHGCIQHCRHIRGFDSVLRSDALLAGVHCIPCGSLEQLRNIVLELDYYLLMHPKVKLIVLDSLAFLYYSDPILLKAKSWMARNKNLYYFAQEFNRLIDKYGVAVVVTNNMTTRFEDGERFEVPFLGPAWPYIPQIRLQLQKNKDQRLAVLHKHFTCLPAERTAPFRIRTAGIR
ncbi:unnamed protein product [Allacma fusca]|uniref:DNA repair protein RAD51 homolog 3 n=1 Tax=Allacma fusca TaxID=39272 RepID=A0A8J2Q079_9HEXA|nr:unnamed protein product [Allacma fusca]